MSHFLHVWLFPPDVTLFSRPVTLFRLPVTLRVTPRVDNRRMFSHHLNLRRLCEAHA